MGLINNQNKMQRNLILAVGSLAFLGVAGIATSIYSWRNTKECNIFTDQSITKTDGMNSLNAESASKPLQAPTDAQSIEYIPDMRFEVSYSEEAQGFKTNIKIKDGDTLISEISEEGSLSPEIIKQSDSAVYIGLFPDGVGGYILYPLDPIKSYRYDLQKKTMSEIKGVVGDVSLDEKLIVGRESGEQEGKIKIVVRKIDTGEVVREFPVPDKYLQAGTVMFSPNGKKIAYAAALGDPDLEEESSEVFWADIENGTQNVAEQPSEGVYEIKRWKDNERLLTEIY